MSPLGEALRAMPDYVLVIGGLMLLLGSFADEAEDQFKNRSIHEKQRGPIDDVFSWVCFWALFLFTIAYFWPK